MTGPGWRIRLGQPADRGLLATFCCADPTTRWQTEVEHFIRTQLADWTFAPHAQEDDPRLLLAFAAETDELFGVAAHEQVVMQASDGTIYPATKLEVIAIAQSWQGKRFVDGVRASDVLMSALMTDVSARVPPRDARVFAVVHEDNTRSIALCQRYGLIEEMSRPHPSYRRLVTVHRPPRPSR